MFKILLLTFITTSLIYAQSNKEDYTIFYVVAILSIFLSILIVIVKKKSQKSLDKGKSVENIPTKPFIFSKDRERLLVSIENRFSDFSQDALSFLRLKSKKVEISHEVFNINNVLNEVSGSLYFKFKEQQNEIIFDIDKQIPRNLIGDLLHVTQILYRLFEFIMEKNSLEINLNISLEESFDDEVTIRFNLSNKSLKLSKDEINRLFIPLYNESEDKYIGLNLFVTQELVKMMGGSLIAKNSREKGFIFELLLPFKLIEHTNRRKYRLPTKELIDKNVLIVDDNINSALAIKKLFTYFKHNITVIKKEDFTKDIPNFLDFDIVVLYETLFNNTTLHLLEKAKIDKELKIVALSPIKNALYSKEESYLSQKVDRTLAKPLNQERVFELLLYLYKEKIPTRKRIEESKEIEKIEKEDFKVFKEKHILIVEDNLVNQEVLKSLLIFSNIKISTAQNGKEAIESIKNSFTPFDLVLIDINIPIIDGYGVTEIVRKEEEFKSLPIIGIPTITIRSEVEKMSQSGMDAFISKPVTISKLYEVMKIYFK